MSDDYIVASIERTGYPPWNQEDFGRDCLKCDGAIEPGDVVYELDYDGELIEVCQDCFKDWLEEYFSTNPEMIADALEIKHYK